MASVVVCPHCYLQLLVPDGIEPDARVECPACRDDFDLADSSPRALPKVVRVEPSSDGTTTSKGLVTDDAPTESDQREEQPADAESPGEEPAELEIEPIEPSPSEKSAVTLADLQPPTAERIGDEDDTLATVAPGSADESQAESLESPDPTTAMPGPTIELPNVPLSKNLAATVDPGSDSPSGSAANTDFELDDVEIDAANSELDDRKTVAESADITVDVRAGSLPGSDQLEWDTQRATTSPQPTAETSFDDSPSDLAATGFEANVAPVIAPVIAPIVNRPRRRSVIRMLVGCFIFGVGGLAVGYYVLLHLLGPRGDFLDISQYLPAATLPASFHTTPTQVADSTEPEAPQLDATTGAYDVERARFETPATTPLPADLPRVSGGPSYTLDDLATALIAAQAAQPGFVAGDLRDPAVRQAKGRSYAKLCELAHVLTFCDDTSTAELARLEREAEDLFRNMLADAHTRGEVAVIATFWIEMPNRQHGGVFLAGSISGGEIAGDVYEYRLQAEDGTTHVLLLPQPLDSLIDSPTTMLGIIGAIVERPSEEIAGYTGDAPQALWVRSAIALE